MTDNEIIKALECCVVWDCDKCSYKKEQWNCRDILNRDVYDLIRRQQNKLIETTDKFSGYWKAYIDEYEICGTEFICSNCNESFASSELTDKQFYEMMKYCPNCGTRMDKRGADNEK